MVWIDYDDGHAGGYPHECEQVDLLTEAQRGRRWVDKFGNRWWWNEVWASFNSQGQMVDCSAFEPAGHFRGPFLTL